MCEPADNPSLINMEVEESSSPKFYTIDPEGDVSLVVGTEKEAITIKVSSRVLSLASSVFSAMLRPHFSEGSQLMEEGSTEVELVEDDPDAMLWICKYLHHRLDIDVDDPIEPKFLEKVAIASDKYDVVGAIRGWARFFTSKLIADQIHESDRFLSQMIKMSYLFKDRDNFYKCTSRLLKPLDGRKPISHISIGPDADDIPGQVCGKIFVPRYLEFEIYADCVFRSAYIIRKRSSLLYNMQCEIGEPQCRGRSKMLVSERESTYGHYYRELARIGLWPISKMVRVNLFVQQRALG